jgi:GT2 family glycosyltransferase
VANLERAAWISADLAVRRSALEHVDGFDERFPRAYREDTDLAIRLHDAGYRIDAGDRTVVHPTRPERWDASVRAQRGNADDALMRRLHGRTWRRRGRAPSGRLRSHVAIAALTSLAIVAAAAGRVRTALVATGGAVAAIARFAQHRIRSGPGGIDETLRMIATSLLIPYVATYHAAVGTVRARRLAPGGPADRWGTR